MVYEKCQYLEQTGCGSGMTGSPKGKRATLGAKHQFAQSCIRSKAMLPGRDRAGLSELLLEQRFNLNPSIITKAGRRNNCCPQHANKEGERGWTLRCGVISVVRLSTDGNPPRA